MLMMVDKPGFIKLISNYKSHKVNDNFGILNVINGLLSSTGFNKDEKLYWIRYY